MRPVDRTYQNTFRLGSHPTIVLNNNSLRGSISVQGWTQEEVKVVADLESEKTEVRCSKGAEMLSVSLRRQGMVTDDSVNFHIWTPRRSALESSAVSGSIAVQDMEGRLKLRTTDGSIELKNCTGENVDALSSTNGDIRLDGPLSPSTLYNLYSGSGSIEVRLTPTSSFPLNASTQHGRIKLGGIKLRTVRQSERHVEGDYGGGSSILNLRTHSGQIQLRLN